MVKKLTCFLLLALGSIIFFVPFSLQANPTTFCDDMYAILNALRIPHVGPIEWNSPEVQAELATLMASSRANNQRAITELAAKMTSIVWPVISNKVDDANNGLDILQITLSSVLGSAQRGTRTEPIALIAFAFRITYNQVERLNQRLAATQIHNESDLRLTNERRIRDIVHLDEFVAPPVSPPSEIWGSRTEDIENTLRFLAEPRAREILRLRFIRDYSLEEIGREYNITVERVRQIISAALGDLRTHHFARLFGLTNIPREELLREHITLLLLPSEINLVLNQNRIFTIQNLIRLSEGEIEDILRSNFSPNREHRYPLGMHNYFIQDTLSTISSRLRRINLSLAEN